MSHVNAGWLFEGTGTGDGVGAGGRELEDAETLAKDVGETELVKTGGGTAEVGAWGRVVCTAVS